MSERAKFGCELFVESLPNRNNRPPGLSNSAEALKRVASGRTARAVTRFAVCLIAIGSSSNRALTTSVAGSAKLLTASRRKAAFRVFDSTSVSESSCRTTFSGSAGDPPPDPKSNQTPLVFGIAVAATRGSTNSRSKVSSVGPWRGRAVRFILTFHFASSRKYASSSSTTSAGTCTCALRARRVRRSLNSRDVTSRAYNRSACKRPT